MSLLRATAALGLLVLTVTSLAAIHSRSLAGVTAGATVANDDEAPKKKKKGTTRGSGGGSFSGE